MSKRVWEDFDPNKSDSDDEDYDANVHRPTNVLQRSKSKSKPRRKRQRTKYEDEDPDDISDSMLDDDSLSDEGTNDEDSDNQEVNEATGRPLRRSAKRQIKYDDDSDEGSIEYMNRINEDSKTSSPHKSVKSHRAKPSLVVKLSLPSSSRGSKSRGTMHKRQDSSASKRSHGNAPSSSNLTRRSSRLARDESERLVALTNSGNHEDVIRPGTRSPEASEFRHSRATKSLKKPPSAIFEADDQGTSSHETRKFRTEFDHENEGAIISDIEDFEGTGAQDAQSNVEVTATQMVADENEDDRNMDLIVPESNVEEEDDDDDDEMVRRPRRNARLGSNAIPLSVEDDKKTTLDSRGERNLRSIGASGRSVPKGLDDTSDFEPDQINVGDEDISASSDADESPRKRSTDIEENNVSVHRSRVRRRNAGSGSSASDGNDSEVAEEIAVELQELQESRPRRKRQRGSLEVRPRTRTRKPVDYRILRPETNLMLEDEGAAVTSTPSKRKGGAGGGWQRTLYSTYGPFGGGGGPPPVFGGQPGATGGVDSDSSDDDVVGRPRGGALPSITAATPTANAPAGFGMFPPAQTHSSDPLQTTLGKVKDKQALADADPLGVDPKVTFDGVGGMKGHIDQLKEMVMLPLLYPEIFQRFKITPPRGVLFHGPPGTGKTLLARALASTVSSQGRKVTFYMRKGADALSKWVGEAERQLRLLFEEARKNQPSIIFFDEIDGLAPVRSSKQEQIHASIVSTLLALMDGMDGRGQVIVIGATNRPDSVDPALRRPGRFDREFYFPLPDQVARRAIIDIHTKGWEPALSDSLKEQLAAATKGYGGADLRALCTEAALNSVQRTYPQIYKSYEKRLIKPEAIQVTSKDFMLSLDKIVPSSERSATSGSSQLPRFVAPLLESAFDEIKTRLDDMIPRKIKRSALEEAEFEDSTKDAGLHHELLQEEFSKARIFRPRLLIHGPTGMGQHYIAAAVLNHLEGLHIQNFDLSALLGDTTRSTEAAIVQFFMEVRRHKPGIIYLPNVGTWCNTIGESAVTTFLGLLQSLAPSDPVLVLGIADENIGHELSVGAESAMRRLFGYSAKNSYVLQRPTKHMRQNFFAPIGEYLRSPPTAFPSLEARKRRILEELPLAPKFDATVSKEPTKEQAKIQMKKDRRILNNLKLRIQPIMDQIRMKYKKFRTPVIEESQIRYLFDEEDPDALLTTDLPLQARQQAHYRPFERGQDARGEPGLIEVSTGKFFYNMETVTIEKRLSNGYYKRPKDFLGDIKKLAKDAKTSEDPERVLKAQELQTNVEVDIDHIEITEPWLYAECEALYDREQKASQHTTPSAQSTNVPMAPPEAPDHRRHKNENAILPSTRQGIGVSSDSQRPDPPRTDTFYHASQSFMSNGTSDLDNLPGQRVSNSTSNTSNGFKTTPSSETQSTDQATQANISFGQSAQTRSIYHSTGVPSTVEQRFQAGQLSQRGAITPIAEGAHPSMYNNSASTTSSDKQNATSSGDRTTQSTQIRVDAHVEGNRLDISNLEGQPISNTQLPDTQSTPQDASSSHSLDKLRAVTISMEGLEQSQSTPSQPSEPPALSQNFELANLRSFKDQDGGKDIPVNRLQVDEAQITELIDRIVRETSGFSIEQLEQVNSTLMDRIWRSRGSWDRSKVVGEATSTFSQTLDDMRSLQQFANSSMENGV